MSELNYHQKFIDLKTCVLIPTYNNEQTLKQVIESVLEYTSNVLVINDGSTDSTLAILAQFPQVNNVGYAVNQGKGFALLFQNFCRRYCSLKVLLNRLPGIYKRQQIFV